MRAKKDKTTGYTDPSIAFFDQLMGLKIIENGDNSGVYNLRIGEMILLEEFAEKAFWLLNLQSKLIIKKTDSAGNIESKVVADLTKIRHRTWSPKFDHGSLIEEYCKPLIEEIFNEEG